MIELKGQAVPAPNTRVASLRSLLIGAGEAGRAMAHALRLTVYWPDQGWFAVIRPSSLNATFW